MGTEANVTLRADIRDLTGKLQSIPGITAGEAKRMAAEIEKGLKRAELATKRSLDAQRKAAASTETAFNSLAGAARALGFGAVAEKANNAAMAMEGLGASGAAGIAAGGLVAVGVAGVAAAAGILKAIDAAPGLEKLLKPFRELQGFEGLSPEAMASIERAGASMDALGTITKQAVVVLAQEFSPGVESAGEVVVAFGLMALDAWEKMATGKDVLKEITVWLTDHFVRGMMTAATMTMDFVGILGKAATALGASGLGASLQEVSDAYDSWTESVARTAVDAWWQAGSDGMRDLTASTGDYLTRARDLIGVQAEVNRKLLDGSKAAKKAKDVLIGTLAGMEIGAAIKSIQSLSDEAAHMFPGPVLSDLERANELLARLQVEAAFDAVAAGELADEIALVTAETERLRVASTRSGGLSGWLGLADGSVLTGLQAVSGGISSIAGMIGGPLAGALASLFTTRAPFAQLREELEALPNLLARFPEKLKNFYVDFAASFLPAIIGAVPAIVEGLAMALADPAFWGAVMKLNLEILRFMAVGWLEILLKLGKDMGAAVMQVLQEGVGNWARGLWEEFLAVFDVRALFQDLGQVLKDAFREVVTGGRADTRTFGDTPGPVHVGPQGMTASFAPGDQVVAARDLRGVLAQVLDAAAPQAVAPLALAGAGGAPTYRQTHGIFDAFLRDHLRTSSTLRSVTSAAPRTGRVNPYGR